jgi:hypothetical protein
MKMSPLCLPALVGCTNALASGIWCCVPCSKILFYYTPSVAQFARGRGTFHPTRKNLDSISPSPLHRALADARRASHRCRRSRVEASARTDRRRDPRERSLAARLRHVLLPCALSRAQIIDPP